MQQRKGVGGRNSGGTAMTSLVCRGFPGGKDFQSQNLDSARQRPRADFFDGRPLRFEVLVGFGIHEEDEELGVFNFLPAMNSANS